ncbi:hypothetical protein ABBQ38_010870 [Trebouxia sp. C0009 RCD-2024]
MGCFGSKSAETKAEKGRALRRPVWASEYPMTKSELQQKREEFWDTAPHYGGDRVIWDALKAACESDLQTAQLIVNSAGVIVTVPDLSTCFDERGSKYELPRYVLSEPSNLISERDSKQQTRQQVELTARRM